MNKRISIALIFGNLIFIAVAMINWDRIIQTPDLQHTGYGPEPTSETTDDGMLYSYWELAETVKFSSFIRSIQFSPDSSTLYIPVGTSIREWNVEQGRFLTDVFSTPVGSIVKFQVGQLGYHLAVPISISTTPGASLINLREKDNSRRISLYYHEIASVFSLKHAVLSPNEKNFLTVHENVFFIWSLETYDLISTFELEDVNTWAIFFLADDEHFIFQDKDTMEIFVYNFMGELINNFTLNETVNDFTFTVSTGSEYRFEAINGTALDLYQNDTFLARITLEYKYVLYEGWFDFVSLYGASSPIDLTLEETETEEIDGRILPQIFNGRLPIFSAMEYVLAKDTENNSILSAKFDRQTLQLFGPDQQPIGVLEIQPFEDIGFYINFYDEFGSKKRQSFSLANYALLDVMDEDTLFVEGRGNFHCINMLTFQTECTIPHDPFENEFHYQSGDYFSILTAEASPSLIVYDQTSLQSIFEYHNISYTDILSFALSPDQEHAAFVVAYEERGNAYLEMWHKVTIFIPEPTGQRAK